MTRAAIYTRVSKDPHTAEPDLRILHPSTWSAIRRIKTTADAYAIGDPTN